MKDVWMLLCLSLAGILGAQCADRDFEAIVRRLEAQFGKDRTHVPGLGFANFLVKVSRPEGVSDLKIAMFEDLDVSRQPSAEALDHVFDSLAAEGWRPFVRVRSRGENERADVYCRLSGKRWELLVTTIERSEATVVRMRLSPQALARWIDDPGGMAVKKEGASGRDTLP